MPHRSPVAPAKATGAECGLASTDLILAKQLAEIRERLLSSAQPLASQCVRLATDAEVLNLGVTGEDLQRVAQGAHEFVADIGRLFDMDSDVIRENKDDPSAIERKLRHDLKGSLTVVKGFLELAIADLRQMDAVAQLEQSERVLAGVAALEEEIGHAVKWRSLRPAEEKAPPPRLPPAPGTVTETPVDRQQSPDSLTGRILVVDDQAAGREIMTRLLRHEGHAVDEAADGPAALRLMAQNPFDVVLLDLIMPGMSGFEVMERMQHNDMLRNLSVIVVSALDQEQSAIDCIAHGAEDYLAKPVNPMLLNARIGACLMRKRWRDQESTYRMHIEAAMAKSEALLFNALPAPIVDRLASGERVIADSFDNATVLFSDFVKFTNFSGSRHPGEVVEVLDRVFSEFDDLALRLGVEKIKTIGDGYLAVAAVPIYREDHAEVMADMALGMIEVLNCVNERLGTHLEIRIGIHSGPVVAGVIGSHRFAYDVWGHTVNVAARHESYSRPQHVHVSQQTASLIHAKFELVSCGAMTMRGIGEVETFFLTDRKPIPSEALEIATSTRADAPAARILVADDDARMRELLARWMHRQNWRVDFAADGAEAWELIGRVDYDLMVTDCDMPNVDGFELARRVREHEDAQRADVPIVALTASTDRDMAERCRTAGMNAFLRKPVMWSELKQCANRFLHRSNDDRLDVNF